MFESHHCYITSVLLLVLLVFVTRICLQSNFPVAEMRTGIRHYRKLTQLSRCFFRVTTLKHYVCELIALSSSGYFISSVKAGQETGY